MMNPMEQTSGSPHSWIENLALDELNMDESGVVRFNDHLAPEKYLEEAAIEFINSLREKFEFYVHRFNELRSELGSSHGIKIFKISNTICDFMLFRNSLKLIVAKTGPETISVGFLSNSGGLFSARLNNQTPAINAAHELKASLGPFNDIQWKFDGETVDQDALVRHYLTEFIKHSAH